MFERIGLDARCQGIANGTALAEAVFLVRAVPPANLAVIVVGKVLVAKAVHERVGLLVLRVGSGVASCWVLGAPKP